MVGMDRDLGHAATREAPRAQHGAVEQPGGARRPQGALHARLVDLADQRLRQGVPSGAAGLDDHLASPRTVTPHRGLKPPNVVTCRTTSDAPEGCGSVALCGLASR
jgi:hypothetical protein